MIRQALQVINMITIYQLLSGLLVRIQRNEQIDNWLASLGILPGCKLLAPCQRVSARRLAGLIETTGSSVNLQNRISNMINRRMKL